MVGFLRMEPDRVDELALEEEGGGAKIEVVIGTVEVSRKVV